MRSTLLYKTLNFFTQLIINFGLKVFKVNFNLKAFKSILN